MLGRTIEARGVRLTTRCVPRLDLSEIDPLRPDLLVVMGGPIGAYQTDDYPFLVQEIELVKKRVEKDLPTIGICLGSQIIAAALGAKVYKGDQGPELGWHPLEITKEGMNGPARHFAADKTNMLHWHGDTFDLPDGATLLASTAKYKNQIYTHGKNILGVQCHPELRRERLKEWEVMGVAQVTGPNATLPIKQWRADNDKYIDTLNMQSAAFFHEWLGERGL